MTLPLPPVDAVRRFNRFYTRLVGALDEGHLRSAFTLAEGRVLYELAHRDGPTAADVARELGLDAGYLSRIVRRFEEAGLVARDASPTDARRSHLRLTEAGRAAFGELDARARDDVAARVDALPPSDRRRLLAAMHAIESVLGAGRGAGEGEVALRDPRPGDYGWVIARNGAIYAEDYGWDATYEALVARIVADFAERFDPAWERCWIAEYAGANAGCIFLVKHPDRPGVAKLRLLLVEPWARGLGIGRRLVDACVSEARARGYDTMTLWTQSMLPSARRTYQAAGFQLVSETPTRMFGHDLVSQTWELALSPRAERGVSDA